MEPQEQWWWAAEVARLRGVLFWRPPGTPQAGAEAYGGKPWTRPAAGDNMIMIAGQSYLDKAGESVPLK